MRNQHELPIGVGVRNDQGQEKEENHQKNEDTDQENEENDQDHELEGMIEDKGRIWLYIATARRKLRAETAAEWDTP